MVTWTRMKKRSPMCRGCGATKDYIKVNGDGFKCTLCGKTWERY